MPMASHGLDAGCLICLSHKADKWPGIEMGMTASPGLKGKIGIYMGSPKVREDSWKQVSKQGRFLYLMGFILLGAMFLRVHVPSVSMV
jgi:hypothetical protein